MIYKTISDQTQIKLENESLRVMILPRMGGRIVSLFHKAKSFEAAAQPGRMMGAENGASEPYAFAPYAFGMDDAFPNIEEEDFVWKGRKIHYPDHGEIWRADCQAYGRGCEWVELTAISRYFCYCYEKRMCLEGDSLRIHYKIINKGEEELPAIWTWHGLMRYEENMEILLPKGAERFRNVLDGSVLGKEGTVYPARNDRYDFTKVPRAGSYSAVKFYVESRIAEGCCGFYYPSADMSCMLRYDAEKLPYLGVWITAGGFQGDYNCALEPSNGFYDSISRAAGNHRLPVITAGESIEFDMEVMVKCQR